MEILKDILRRRIREIALKKPLVSVEVLEKANDFFKQKIPEAEAYFFDQRKGILYVYVPNALFSSDIFLREQQILSSLRKLLPQARVRKIRTKVKG